MELSSDEMLLNQIIEAFTVITGNPEAFKEWANEVPPSGGSLEIGNSQSAINSHATAQSFPLRGDP